jgi:hypothetical protein
MTAIKCDFDGVMPRAFIQRVAFVCRVLRCSVLYLEVHRTRRGHHVVIHVNRRLSFMRTVLIQALLGSDWKRETFNSRRASAWRNVPAFWRNRANVLYNRHYRSVKP